MYSVQLPADGTGRRNEPAWTLALAIQVERWLDAMVASGVVGKFSCDNFIYHFEREEDALLFKLRWC